MSLDGFLTFTGLMIATYAVLNPISRLRLKLQFIRQFILTLFFLFVILFFEFYYELKSLFSDAPSWFFDFFPFNPENLGLTNNEAAFLTVLVWMPLAVGLHSFSKPRATSLATLAKLVERLHDEGRYLELIELVSPYLPLIKRALWTCPALVPLHELI